MAPPSRPLTKATTRRAAPRVADTGGLVAHCTELLSALGPVRTRRMFGGYGIYVDELFVAILSHDCLYLKADVETEACFRHAGCRAFSYQANGKVRTALGYWTVPDDAMEAPSLMTPWARLAMAAALRTRAMQPRSTVASRARKPAAKKVRSNAASEG